MQNSFQRKVVGSIYSIVDGLNELINLSDRALQNNAVQM